MPYIFGFVAYNARKIVLLILYSRSAHCRPAIFFIVVMIETVVEFFEEKVAKYADNPLMYEKHNGKYESLTYSQVHDEVMRFAAGLTALGLKKGDRMGLIAEGRTDWLVAELGMFYAGVVNVPLSVKLESGSDIYFRIQHSEARMVIVSASQLQKVEEIFDSIDCLEKIICLDSDQTDAPHHISFAKVKSLGDNVLSNSDLHAKFDAIWHNVAPDDLANISYTSGTTSDPKGIMLTQRNYAVNAQQSCTLMSIGTNDKTLTILPWDHSFAHTACLYCFIYYGAAIAAQEIGRTPIETLKNIPKNINEIKPNLMMSVPALSKAFRKNIENGIKQKGSTAEKIFRQGLKIAYLYNGHGFNRGKNWRILLKPLYLLFDKIMFSKIREGFGGNIKFFIGGGALLDVELQRFFAAIGMPVMQGYGLSEASPVISSNALHAYKFGSSGRLVKYMDLKIIDADGNELPQGEKGEIIIKGGNVMSGYWKNPKATAETIIDGWLHTGDMGYMDKDGFLYVLGRFKSLLIGNDGEKYSPEGIEEAIVDQSAYIDQCMLYNNQNNYTTGMIVPNVSALKAEIQQRGIELNSAEAYAEALTIIESQIDAYKTGGEYANLFPERWLPAAAVVLPEAFTEQNKLINSTMKMVRGKVVEHFATELKFLYTPTAKNIQNEVNIENIKKLFNK